MVSTIVSYSIVNSGVETYQSESKILHLKGLTRTSNMSGLLFEVIRSIFPLNKTISSAPARESYGRRCIPGKLNDKCYLLKDFGDEVK